MNKDVTQFLVYQYAEQLSDVFWEEYDRWPKKVQMTIGLQIIRAADSISANIAEGFGRFHYRDRLRFYYCARGSFEESKSFARKLIRRKVLAEKEVEQVTRLVTQIGPLLNAFINRARKSGGDT